MIAVWHYLPALRTGNTVVIKPSPLTPLSTLRMVELLNEVLPAGVLNVVTGDDRGFNIGAAMSAHPDIDKIVFTGSTATGRHVMRSAAENLKRLTLELGGNDAGIVLPDADPAKIAEGLFWGAFINNGQTCAAMKRLYVHEKHPRRRLRRARRLCRARSRSATASTRRRSSARSRTGCSSTRSRGSSPTLPRAARSCSAASPARVCSSRRRSSPASPTATPLVDEEQFGPALPDHPLLGRRRGDRRGERQPERPRRLGLVLRHRRRQGGRPAHGMRLGLDQQARRHPAERALRRRQAVGLRRRSSPRKA